jgi:hypothetical protein
MLIEFDSANSVAKMLWPWSWKSLDLDSLQAMRTRVRYLTLNAFASPLQTLLGQ